MKIFLLAPITIVTVIAWLYFTVHPGLPSLDISINFASARNSGF